MRKRHPIYLIFIPKCRKTDTNHVRCKEEQLGDPFGHQYLCQGGMRAKPLFRSSTTTQWAETSLPPNLSASHSKVADGGWNTREGSKGLPR